MYLDPYGLREIPKGAGPTAYSELTSGYSTMKNSVVGADQFFHCRSACEASKASGQPSVVREILRGKEIIDFPRNVAGRGFTLTEASDDFKADMAANETGLQCPVNTPCNKQCKPFIDTMTKYPASQRYMRNTYPPY